MKNIKFYYIYHEFEPAIIMLDENLKEAFQLNEFELRDIKQIDYPTNKELKNIIKNSIQLGYDGSLDSLKFLLTELNILENLANSINRREYIELIRKDMNIVDEETNINYLINKLWERFENQKTNIAVKYDNIFERCMKFLQSLNDEESNKLVLQSQKITNKEYFYKILELAKINEKIKENDFSF